MRAEDDSQIIGGIKTNLARSIKISKELPPKVEVSAGIQKVTLGFKTEEEDGATLKGIDRFLGIDGDLSLFVREWSKGYNNRPLQVGVEWTFKDGGPTTNIKHWVDLRGHEYLRVWLATSGEPGYIRGAIYHRPSQGVVLENHHQFVLSGFHYLYSKPIGLEGHPLEGVSLDINVLNCGDGFNRDFDEAYQLTSLSEALVGNFEGDLEVQTDDGLRKYHGKVNEVVVMPTGIYKPTVFNETFCHPAEVVDDPKRPWTTWLERLGVKYSLSYSGQFID